MAGDADMGRDEMVGRIALLEALIYALIEQRALQLGETGGVDGVTPFVGELGNLVRDRTEQMPEVQKEFARQHLVEMLRVLQDRLLPKTRGATVN